ncbi:MAG: rRNA methyltransferase [Arachnia propionica]|nr:MAG: rRNA methyltransferase [Arachnia propionica]
MRYDIADAADPRVADFVSLRDSQLRKRLEAERGIFIAEGTTIIQRAIAAGCQPRAFLLSPRWLAGLAEVLANWPQLPCYVAAEEMVEAISGFHVHRGALAAFDRPEQAPWELIEQANRIIVCEALVDHANTGAIIRVAAGLGWDAVLVSAAGADPLYRRAIKSSMGASLQLPWRRLAADDELTRLRRAGFTLAATVLADDAVALAEFSAPAKLALLVGSEGHGLSAAWQQLADVRLTIDMANKVDSLNVAAATAIFAYALR